MRQLEGRFYRDQQGVAPSFSCSQASISSRHGMRPLCDIFVQCRNTRQTSRRSAFIRSVRLARLSFATTQAAREAIEPLLRSRGDNAKGRVEIVSGMAIEHIQINTTDPWTEVDGERSNAKTKHPMFSDPAVRGALGLLVDRGSIEAHIYGRTGVATGNFINSPERFVSKNTKWEFSVDKANQLLDEAGWMVEDGVVIPVVSRPQVSAISKKLRATLSGWDSTFWNLKDRYREE